uniref:Uncharacterized protein n=1 Tax=Physcomitrium patens TaxID=3218 RepID=A0A2K1JKI0_PHYPA|nr:hypothetical protein PHYPA_016892 [Physcomitrium patens]
MAFGGSLGSPGSSIQQELLIVLDIQFNRCTPRPHIDRNNYVVCLGLDEKINLVDRLTMYTMKFQAFMGL